MNRCAARKVLIAGLSALDGELDWFEQKAQQYELDLSAANHPACKRYVDYLIAAAYTQPVEVLLPILFAVEAAYFPLLTDSLEKCVFVMSPILDSTSRYPGKNAAQPIVE